MAWVVCSIVPMWATWSPLKQTVRAGSAEAAADTRKTLRARVVRTAGAFAARGWVSRYAGPGCPWSPREGRDPDHRGDRGRRRARECGVRVLRPAIAVRGASERARARGARGRRHVARAARVAGERVPDAERRAARDLSRATSGWKVTVVPRGRADEPSSPDLTPWELSWLRTMIELPTTRVLGVEGDTYYYALALRAAGRTREEPHDARHARDQQAGRRADRRRRPRARAIAGRADRRSSRR